MSCPLSWGSRLEKVWVLPKAQQVSVRPSDLFQEDSDPPISESLSIENALWAGTVIASGKGAF